MTKELDKLSAKPIQNAWRLSRPPTPRFLIGCVALALAFASNLPFTVLALKFNYPSILRQPASEVLRAFAAGGPELIFTWYAYGLSALALVPLSLAFAFGWTRWREWSGLAIGSAIIGSLAGLTQAIGLFRWVFVVPSLARAAMDPNTSAAALSPFNLMNLFGGVTIGEHMGQALTCFWVLLVVLVQWKGSRIIDRASAPLGIITIFGIGLGLGEGLCLALGIDGSGFGLATTIGFLGLTLWLIATGLGFLLRERTSKAPA